MTQVQDFIMKPYQLSLIKQELYNLGIDSKKYDQKRLRYPNVSDFEFVILLLAGEIEVAEKLTGYKRRFKRQQEIYSVMVKVLLYEGRSTINIRRKIALLTLRSGLWEKAKVKANIVPTKGCPEAKFYSGMMFPINVAIDLELIPNARCSKPEGCTCHYEIIEDKDDSKLTRI